VRSVVDDLRAWGAGITNFWLLGSVSYLLCAHASEM
jgi:hypothetical protein